MVWRGLISILTLLSLVLLVATPVMCGRSHRVYDDVEGGKQGVYLEALSGAGCLHLQVAIGAPSPPSPLEFAHRSGGLLDDLFSAVFNDIHPTGGNLNCRRVEWFGFGWTQGTYDFLQAGEEKLGPASPMVGVTLPYWAIALVFAILPGSSILTHWRRRSSQRTALS